jgi:hypothetical protein
MQNFPPGPGGCRRARPVSESANVGVALTTQSFLATQLVFLVISGAASAVIGAGGVWLMARAGKAGWVFARSRVAPRLLGRWATYRMRNLLPRSSATELVPSEQVRLVGVVEADTVAMAELSGEPTVVSRHEVGERGGGSVERGLCAVDFSLRLEDGNKVKILARDAAARRALRLLDGEPHRWLGYRDHHGWYCESRVAPGDRVEVIGQLSREIDAQAERASDRQPGLSWTLVAGHDAMSLRFRTRPPVRPCGF